MGDICKGGQRSIEKNLLAFRSRHPVPLPVLQDVSFVPFKTNAVAQNIVRGHTSYVYANNIQLSRDDNLSDAFTDFGSRFTRLWRAVFGNKRADSTWKVKLSSASGRYRIRLPNSSPSAILDSNHGHLAEEGSLDEKATSWKIYRV